MHRPLPLLPFLLLVLFTTQINAAAQKPGRAKPAPLKPAVTKPAAAKPSAAKPALRLVVQQGMSNLSYGFISFSPDGRLVATGHNGGDVVVWDVASGREVRRLSDNSGDPGAQDVDGGLWGAFSPDGRLLATSVGPHLRLWDLWTGKRLWLAKHEDNAFFTPPEADAQPPVAFAPGGRQLVVTGTTYRLTWDARTGRLLSRVSLRRPSKELESFALRPPRTAVSPGGRFVASAKDGLVNVTEKATGKSMGSARFLV